MTTEQVTEQDNGTDTISGELEPYQPEPRTTAIVYREQERDVVDGWMQHASSIFKLSEFICGTEFVPKPLRNNPAAVAACILSGRELGLGPMTSLRHVQMVEGSPSLSAEYKRARVQSRGHDFIVIELSTVRCTIKGRRKGTHDWLEITYTIEDAKRAGLVKPRGAWETRPRRMLFARAGGEVCDFMFSDCTNGLPTTELMTADGPPDLAPAAAPPAGEVVRKAQRKTPAGSRQQPAGSPVSAPPEPPLPGEENGEDEVKAPPDPTPASGTGPAKPARPSATAAPAGAPPPKQGEEPAVRDASKMVTKINTLFTATFGMKGRSDKLRAVSALAGRQVESSKDLTWDECKAVIDSMEQAAQAPQESDRVARLLALVSAWEDSQRPAAERESEDI